MQIPEKIDANKLTAIQNDAGRISTVNAASGIASDSVSLILSLFSLDFGGHLMKLSQMNKLFCRYRFLDINYGTYLGGYFRWSA